MIWLGLLVFYIISALSTFLIYKYTYTYRKDLLDKHENMWFTVLVVFVPIFNTVISLLSLLMFVCEFIEKVWNKFKLYREHRKSIVSKFDLKESLNNFGDKMFNMKREEE